MPSNSNSNLDNKAPSAPLILLRSNAINTSTSKTSTFIYKEYSIRTRIKALIILNNKVFIARIIKAIRID
jgi:hypothetical protein